MQDLETLFEQLKKLLQKYAKGPVEGTNRLIDSKAKDKKPVYVLYGKKEVAIGKRKPQKTYIVGVMLQKNFVGFYSMPIYAFPKELKIQNEKLKKTLKGKSCFNLKTLDKDMLKEIDNHIKNGIALFKKEEWI